MVNLYRISPLLDRLRTYQRKTFLDDLVAGIVVAVMLVPQAMAYAMMAGLPPQIGLYASLLPVLLYAALGTSNTLAVGPVAMVALLVLAGVSQYASPGSEEYLQLMLLLSALIGLVHLLMAIFRFGFLVNFISHPVLVGFTTAAAITIGLGQIKHLLGTEIADTEYPILMLWPIIVSLSATNWVTTVISVTSVVALVFFNLACSRILQRRGISPIVADTLAKLGPLSVVILATLVTRYWGLAERYGVAIVGSIPSGLPGLKLPTLDPIQMVNLIPLAIVITVISYVESISVVKVLANLRREKVDPNRELWGLGFANLGAAISGGMPVSGGFSRSMVNFSAGAQTQVAAIITAGLLAVSVLFLTPAFFYIPNCILAAIIVVAVVKLIDLRAPFKLWRYCWEDGLASLITSLAVLTCGIERGIVIGVLAAFVLLVYRKSRPHIAVVGRLAETDIFRNKLNYPVKQTDGILAIRVDESLNFINTDFFERFLIDQVDQAIEVKSVLLIGSGINDIDSTGIDSLRTIKQYLSQHQIDFYLSEIKRPVLDRLRKADFDDRFLEEQIFLTTQAAMSFLETASQNLIQTKTASTDTRTEIL